jgi:putative sterol carrier protein
VARFLSPEWIEDMNRAVSTSPALRQATSAVSLTVQQVVRDGDQEHCYVVRIDHGTVTVEAGRAPEADITVTEDAETAAALAKGDLTPQAAFMVGRIRVGGDMSRLMTSYEALGDMDAAFAPVRAATTY